MEISPEGVLKKCFVIFWHHLTYFILFIPLRTIFRFHVTRPKELHASQLIITNHKSLFDSWFFGCTLPYNQFRKIAPIRFLASQIFQNTFLNIIYKFIIYPLIYWPYGVIILPPRNKNHILTIEVKTRGVIEALQNNETVLMFPEGHIYKKEGIDNFKRGPVFIQKQTSASLLLASIQFSGGPWWLPWTKRRIYWSQHFVRIPNKFAYDEEQGAKWLRDEVLKLYNNQ